MSDNPDWVFYRDARQNEATSCRDLFAEFPEFRPRWEKHLNSWNGEPAGTYIDIAQFVHFVVEDLYPSGKTEEIQRVFDLMEQWLENGNENVRQLVIIGFFEDLQNVASWHSFGRQAFIPFLRLRSREAWDDIEKIWVGKSSLAEVIRAERGKRP
jgi:hypothetical protein